MNSADVMRMLHRLSQPEHFQPDPPTKAPRAKKVKHITPPSSDSEYSDTDSESDDGVELERIKGHFEKEPCEYVSPAALKATKTKKEAMKYLESKDCPKIPAIKKGKMEGPPAPSPATAPAKKVRKAKVVEVVPAAPAPVEVSAPAPPKVKRAKKVAEALPPVAAAPAPAPAPAEKKKRPATAYALAVGKHRKAGLSFAEAAKKAKAEIDAAKAK